MSKRILCIILSIVITVAVIGCSKGAPATPLKRIAIGLSFAFKDSAYHFALEDYLAKAADQYAEKNGCEISIISVSANKSAVQQEKDIESLLSKNIDVLLIYPQDAKAINKSISLAHSKNVPVIMYTRAASENGEQAEMYVGLDTFKQAYTTAVALFELMAKDKIEPQVLILQGDMADENAVNRHNGFLEAVKQYDAEVLDIIQTNWDTEKAFQGLSSSLDKYPQSNCLLCAGDYLLSGITPALKGKNRWFPYGNSEHIYFGSQDVLPTAIGLLQEGYIDYDTAADIWPIAQKTVQMVVALANKETIDRKSLLIEGRLVSKTNISTIENLWSRDY